MKKITALLAALSIPTLASAQSPTNSVLQQFMADEAARSFEYATQRLAYTVGQGGLPGSVVSLSVSTLPTPTPTSGGNLWVDSNGALHFQSPFYDTLMWGSRFIGDTRPWLLGSYGMAKTGGTVPPATGTAGDRPLLQLTRNETYTGGTPGALIFDVQENYQSGTGFAQATTAGFPIGTSVITVVDNGNITNGMSVYGGGIDLATTATITRAAGVLTATLSKPTIGEILQANIVTFGGTNVVNMGTAHQATMTLFTNQLSAGAANVATAGYCFKYIPSSTSCFGGNFLSRDFTGRQSSVHLGGMIGFETDIVASGPDDNHIRVNQDNTFREEAPSVDGPTTIDTVIRIRPSVSGQSVNPTTALHGVYVLTIGQSGPTNITGGSLGGFVEGYLCDGGVSLGCFDAISATLPLTTAALANTAQPVLTFTPPKGINVGQFVDGNANIPTNTHVLTVLQCPTVGAPSACGSNVNVSVVTLDKNLTGSIAGGSTINFHGVFGTGSTFNGYFTNAMADWTALGSAGLFNLGSDVSTNAATVLTTAMRGKNSLAAAVTYGSIVTKITSNTAASEVGEVDITATGTTGLVQAGPVFRATNGANCSGAPTGGFTVAKGIVTVC